MLKRRIYFEVPLEVFTARLTTVALLSRAHHGAIGLLNSRPSTACFLVAFTCLLSGLAVRLHASEASQFFDREIKPIVATYCTDCHGAESSKADLRLDQMEVDFAGPQGETWHDILNRVEVGEMPPQDAEPIPTAARRKLTQWIRAQFHAAQQTKANGGRSVVRRLTRYEYNNTLSDLTGITLDYAQDLPPDSMSSNGFRNNGSVLGISAIQMEYYVLAARRAMSKAIVTGPAPEVYTHRFETSSPSNTPKIKTPVGNRMTPGSRFFGKMLEFPRVGEFKVRIKAAGSVPVGEGFPRMRVAIGLRSDTVSPTRVLGEIDVSNPESSPEFYEFRARMEEFPLPGHNPKFPGVTIAVTNVYDDGLPVESPIDFEVVKFARPETKLITTRSKENIPTLPDSFQVSDQKKLVTNFTKTAESLQKRIEELRLIARESKAEIDIACRLFEYNNQRKRLDGQLRQLTKALNLDHSTSVAEFDQRNTAWLDDQQTVIERFQHLTPINRKDDQAIRALLPTPPERSTLVLESLEFEGPLFQQWPPESHRRLLPDSKGSERDRAEHAIATFMARAFRRPVDQSDVEHVLAFYDQIRPDSANFEEAMRESFVMILVSPEFLYLFEPNESSQPRQLDQHELATRISYFLWSSMPDATLTSLAQSAQLSDSAVIQTQVRRMLASPRIDEMINHFTDQWLDLSGIERIAINPEYYPKFEGELKQSMRGETRAFFGELLKTDMSALNLLDSNFLMLNAPLAKHYGLQGPKGGAFERVILPQDSSRGGLLTQASILLLNSTGEDSHPIRRAVWLRSRLLDDPPASPPPDVPDLNSEDPQLATLSVRQQLEHHRTRAACNDCHRGIDPWGIPFENFDAIGQWRIEASRATPKKNKLIKIPVTTASVLLNGQKIQDIQELKDYLIERETRRFARALVSRLFEYGTGRSVTFSDHETLETLTDHFESADYRLSDLIVAIIQCEDFQSK